VRWSVVVGHHAAEAARAAVAAFEARRTDVAVIEATDRATLGDAAAAAAADGRGVFVAGGDGTLNAVVDGFHRAGTPSPVLGVLPAGTGSDFARMFAFPADPDAAVARALDGEDYVIDVGVFEGAWGSRAVLNVGEAGLGATTVELAERLPRSWGPRKYELAFWGALPTFAPGPARLTTDRGEVHLEKGVVVAACNGEFFGGGMRIAPKASIVDGRFDLMVVDSHRAKALTLFPRMKQGLHLTDPVVRRIVTASFSLETERPWPVEIDGDHVGETPLRGHVMGAALRLRV
jgi:diacylglycerol kinase (ATP)